MSPSTSRSRVMHDKETIETAVKRYLDHNESVGVLAKYYKVSQPAVYKWIQQYKATKVAEVNKAHMSPKSIELSDKRDLALQNEELHKELRRTRESLMKLMVKHGEI